MCVDDYPFRHFSAQRPKVCRKFIFVNQQDFAKTYYVNVSQFQEFGDVAFCKILLYLQTKGLLIKNRKFYLPKFNAIVQPYTFCRIQFQALDEVQVIMKVYDGSKSSEQIFQENDEDTPQYKSDPKDESNYFCRMEDVEAQQVNDLFELNKGEAKEELGLLSARQMESEKSGSDRMVDQSQEVSFEKSSEGHKKPKQAERIIKQVIQSVKTWRQLYQSKRCNLTKAAKVVGMSKKSLDDYYLVLRVGEIFGFDFVNNLNNLMGDLRNFIRAQESKVTGKLGKKVKCFELVENMDLDKLMQQYNNSNSGPSLKQ